jgi:hypothetical protein
MLKLLHWLTQDNVARTNAAQASVRLQHRRHERDDAAAFLAQHRKDREQPAGEGVPTGGRPTRAVSPPGP